MASILAMENWSRFLRMSNTARNKKPRHHASKEAHAGVFRVTGMLFRSREPLIQSSPRRRGSSNYLNFLDSRLRGNDKTILDQSFPGCLQDF